MRASEYFKKRADKLEDELREAEARAEKAEADLKIMQADKEQLHFALVNSEGAFSKLEAEVDRLREGIEAGCRSAWIKVARNGQVYRVVPEYRLRELLKGGGQ